MRCLRCQHDSGLLSSSHHTIFGSQIDLQLVLLAFQVRHCVMQILHLGREADNQRVAISILIQANLRGLDPECRLLSFFAFPLLCVAT